MQPLNQPAVALSQTTRMEAGRLVGQGASVVRTFARDTSGNETEITGVQCRVRSAELSGQVVTPQAMTYPLFVQAARFENRGKPGNMTVTCRKGDDTASVTVGALPSGGRGAQTSTTTSQGANGTSVVTTSLVPLTGNISSSYPWAYSPSIRVVFE